MMRVDDRRRRLADDRLDRLHHFEQRHAVHRVVREVEEARRFRTERRRGAPRVAAQLLDRRRLDAGRARGEALPANEDVDAIAGRGMARDRAADSQHFVVRMRGDDEDVHSMSPSVSSVFAGRSRAARRSQNSGSRAVGSPVPGRLPPSVSGVSTSPARMSARVQMLR